MMRSRGSAMEVLLLLPLVFLGMFLGVEGQFNQTLNVLTIGAIDWGNSSGPISTQTVNSTAVWGDELQVKIFWASGSTKDKFELVKDVLDLISEPVDFLVFNDIFYNTLQTQQQLGIIHDTPVLHYQSNISPFASPVQTKVWPSNEVSLLCLSQQTGYGGDINVCEDDIGDIESDIDVPTKVDVVTSVLDSLSWSSLIILYENNTALETKELSGRLSYRNSTYQVFHVARQQHDLHAFLSMVYNTTITSYNNDIHVLLLCSDHCVSSVISAANEFDEINGKKTALKLVSKWLVVLPVVNTANVEKCGLDMDNILVVNYPPGVPDPVYNMSMGLPKTIEQVLLQVGSNNESRNLTELDIRTNVSDTFQQILKSQRRCWRCEVSTLLWKPEGVRLLSPVGYVNRTSSIRLYPRVELYPNTKFGFNKRVFNVSTNVWPPFVNYTVNASLPFEGFCIDLLNELASSLNFSFNLEQPADQQWGENLNGSFTGLVGQLQREEVDLIVAPISIQPEREMVMDFIFPFFTDYTSVLIKKPDPNKTKWRTFIDPFKWRVLVLIGVSLLGVTTFYFLVERWNPFYNDKKKHQPMFGDAFWYMYGALLTQGGEHLPDSQAGRTVVSCWWLFSIVMAATYSGNLIAFLTVNKDKLPFDTLNGLVEQDEYKWGTVGGTFWTGLFEKSNLSVYQKLWQGLQEFNRTNPKVLSQFPMEHLELVNEGLYAYISDRSVMEMFMAQSCDLQMIKESFLPLQYAIGLPNNSAYNKIFSEEMLTIYESGLLQIWKKRWWPKNSFCKGSLTTEAKKIEIVDVQSAFYLIAIGVVIAAIALGCEWVVRYVRSRKDKPKHTNCNGHVNGHLPQYANGVK